MFTFPLEFQYCWLLSGQALGGDLCEGGLADAGRPRIYACASVIGRPPPPNGLGPHSRRGLELPAPNLGRPPPMGWVRDLGFVAMCLRIGSSLQLVNSNLHVSLKSLYFLRKINDFFTRALKCTSTDTRPTGPQGGRRACSGRLTFH